MRLGVVKYLQDGGCGPTKGFYFLRSASSKEIRRRALRIARSEVSFTPVRKNSIYTSQFPEE